MCRKCLGDLSRIEPYGINIQHIACNRHAVNHPRNARSRTERYITANGFYSFIVFAVGSTKNKRCCRQFHKVVVGNRLHWNRIASVAKNPLVGIKSCSRNKFGCKHRHKAAATSCNRDYLLVGIVVLGMKCTVLIITSFATAKSIGNYQVVKRYFSL